VLNRKGKEIPPTSLLNRQARTDGIYAFGVQMHFSHEGKPWILTRKTSARIHQDRKYKEGEKLHLICDGEVVNNPQNEIERILPFSINRFFFFDGEMLRDYEELLEEKSSSMKILKDSIERILGIPYFRLSRNDLKQILKGIERERTTILRRLGGQEYEDLLKEFEVVVESMENLEDSIEILEQQLKDTEIEITDDKRRQEDLKEVKQYAIKRNDIERDIILLDGEIKIIDEKIKNLNADLYKAILYNTSNNILSQLDDKHNAVMEKYDKKIKLQGKLDEVEKGIKLQICQYCGTILNKENLNFLEKEKIILLKEIETVTEIPQPDTSYDAYRQTLRRMNENIINQNEYLEIDEEKNSKIHRIAELNEELNELKEKYYEKDAEESFELEDVIREKEREKGRLEGLISSQKNELQRLQEYKSELNQKITSIDKRELNILDKRIELINTLSQLFDEAISIYTEERKKDVEKEATEIFRMLRSKIDFDSLSINDNYGLSIITTTGESLNKSEWRSAGEEQLVAISLIGALNKCSQIEAPIVMDTPFGRLDLKHGGRVMTFLPKMSNQIILFATDREVRDEDLSHLKGYIKSDYTLEHIGEKIGSKIIITR